jgi:glutaredoxin
MKARTFALPVFFAATLAAALCADAQTNVYRWVDKDGKVQFSDSPPPADAKDATQRRLGGGGPDDAQLPFATQVAAKRNPVTLFTGTDCGDPCVRGRDLLARRGVPFTERDAQNNPAYREELNKVSGAFEVPVLVVGESKLKGFDEDQWQASLDSAGYLRTRLPGHAPVPAPSPAAATKAPDNSSAEPASK